MKKIIRPPLTLLLAALMLATNLAAPVQAVTAADWRAGNIIDDSIFYNKDAMNVTSIQAFLDSKVPVCDSNGTKPYNGTTRAAYSQANGQTLPLICLKNYYEHPVTKQNNLQGQPIVNGALSAAQIISAAAQGYNINPQVLLALLQKEQSLVTDDWPWANQYRSATGYGCPDTAACDSQYYGFYNQVNSAARQFRIYANNPNSFNHVAGTNNNVRLSPTVSCGTMNVFIQNQATASLYNYTPYTPNQAALNNLYGTGDSCSSYGNRNFWRIFSDWFGASNANYNWQTISQGAFTDQTKQQPVNLGQLAPGQRYYLTMVVKNNGNVNWRRDGENPVLLATHSPQDRSSPFCDSTWQNASSCNRVGVLNENLVGPGQYGSFSFYITAPTAPGNYNEVYTQVMAGVSWMNGASTSFPMTVQPPNYSAVVVGQNTYNDSSKQSGVDINHIVPGRRYFVSVQIKNTGNIPWYRDGAHPMRLATSAAQNRMSEFCDNATWEACNRPTRLTQASVGPGQVGTFEFWISSPRPGIFTEIFAPIMEGKSWYGNALVTLNPRVEPFTWNLQSVRAYTDSSRTTLANLGNLTPGQRYYVTIEIQNLGWASWDRNSSTPFMLATTLPNDRTSVMCDPTWASCSRPALLRENMIHPGQTGSFELWITAPRDAGSYTEALLPILDGPAPTRLGGNSIDLRLQVNQPRHTWDIVSQGVFTDSSKATPVNLGNIQPGQRYYQTMVIKNTGNGIWRNSGATPMRLGTATARDRSSPFCDGTWLGCNRLVTLQESSVSPGQNGTFEFWVTAPATKATYNETYAPMIEGLTWLDDHTAAFPTVVK